MRILTITILAFAVAAAPAAGDRVAGATYRGTHSGGGTIQLTLSADGTRVESYVARDVRGDTCVYVAEGDAGDWPGAEIQGEAFEYRLDDAILLRGSFTDRLTATGTLRLHNHASNVKPACDTGTLTWTASTTAPADPRGGGGAPSSPLTGAPQAVTPRRTVSTRVTLARSRTKLAGTLRSADASCRGRRVVTLERGTKRLRTATTKADGSFSFARTASTRGRDVRVRVASRTDAKSICAAGMSKRITG